MIGKALMGASLALGTSAATNPPAVPSIAAASVRTIQRLDPALDSLVSIRAKLRILLRQNDGFFEGPTWVGGAGGYLIVSDLPGNRLLRIDRRGRIATAVANVNDGSHRDAIHDALYTRRDLVGPNGTVATGPGRIVVCIFGGHSLVAIDLASGRRETVAQGTASLPIDMANDVVLGRDGDIYFTAHDALYRIHDKAVILLRRMPANGLAFSPDHGTLYATSGPTTVLKFAVRPDGSLGEPTTFIQTNGDPGKDEFVDGLKVDRRGNVWMVGPGGVWIVDASGRVLGKIRAPEVAMPTGPHRRFTNLAFDAEGRVLYLTAPGGIYSLSLRRR